MIKVWKSEKDGYYQILEVTPRLGELRLQIELYHFGLGEFYNISTASGSGTGELCLFTSSDGYKFASTSYPDIHFHQKTIYLMGSCREKDNDIIKFPLDKFDDIVLAFTEFNKHIKGLY